MRALAILLLCAACGDDTSDGGEGGGGAGGDRQEAYLPGGCPGGAADAPFGRAAVMADCAPDDGPAVTILIGAPADSCREAEGEFLKLFVYDDLPLSGGRVIPGREVFLCPGPGTCAPADGGSVTLDAVEDARGAAGSYDLTFAGRRVAGTFAACACDEPAPICG